MDQSDAARRATAFPDIEGTQGRMNDPDGAAIIKGICGDTMEIYLAISGGRIEDARYATDGCGSSHACGAVAAGLARGRELREALRISPAEVLDALGGDPAVEVHCAILAVMTLHKALAEYIIRFEES